MKRIAFVLYTIQAPGDTYQFELLLSKKFENALRATFASDYDISLKWDTMTEVDAYVLPDPGMPFANEKNLPLIKVPNKLFMTRDAAGIKAAVDQYYQENHA